MVHLCGEIENQQFEAALSGGDFGVLGSYTGIIYQTGSFNKDIINSFATISDAGELTVTSGTPSNPSKVLFSNNVNDPVASLNISNIDYQFGSAILTSNSPVQGEVYAVTNPLDMEQSGTYPLSESYSKTNSWNWNLSQSLTLGVSSTTEVDVPGVAKESVELQLSETTTLSGGQGGSTTETLTATAAPNLTVPAFSEFGVAITYQKVGFSIPYNYTGVATYKSGATANVVGTGTFVGTDGGDFGIAYSCVYEYNPQDPSNNTCPTAGGDLGPGVRVPEPSSLLLLPIALLAVTTIRGIRLARRRAWWRGEPGTVRCFAAGGGEVPFAAAL